jgi:FMN phosphatase YigB (HAD superfamily)
MIKAVIFDFGHTIMDEIRYREVPLRSRPVLMMPGVMETLTQITLSKGIWANTRRARASGIKHWLRRGRIDHYFTWIVTSVDAGTRKPDRRFFEFALNQCGLLESEVLYVGNQLNTDIRGATEYGIQNVWLSGPEYRSPDDSMTIDCIRPAHTIARLQELPALVASLTLPNTKTE